MRGFRLLLWLLLSLNLMGCSPDYAHMAQQRLEYARQNQDDIHIVAFHDTYKSNYLNGILLAAETINQRPGKLLGRNLVVNIEQDQASFDETKPTIRRIAANPKITAVLGHRSSSIAIPASAVYESSQIIFMPSFATAKGLTGYNFQYVFRMTPNAEVIAEQLASVAEQLGYKNIITLYERNDLSRELAFLFEDAAVKRGIKLVQNSSFFEGADNYRPLISQFSSKDFDAVFVASPPQPGGKMVKQLREMGVNTPILGNDSFNLPAYIDAAGAAAKNTIVPAIYRPNSNNPRNTAFVQRYQDKYQEEPDYNAAQGYDSVMLLAAGIEKAGATIPPLLSSTMHYIPAWLGVTGLHAYDAYGDLYGKHYVFNVWQQGEFRPLPAIHVPFLISRFEKRVPISPQPGSEPIRFAEIFRTPMHRDDHQVRLLELAQAIFRFKRIGLIYEDTESGRLAAGYTIVKQMVEQRGVTLVECNIPFSALTQNEIELELIACYGELSLNADAILIVNYAGIDNNLMSRLNNSMTFFKVPAIFVGEKPNLEGIDIILNQRTDVDPQGRGNMEVYRDLLQNIKVHELASYLLGMPEVSINLNSLQYQGFSDAPFLDLAPADFMDKPTELGSQP